MVGVGPKTRGRSVDTGSACSQFSRYVTKVGVSLKRYLSEQMCCRGHSDKYALGIAVGEDHLGSRSSR